MPQAPATKPAPKLLRKQANMRRVLLATLPCVAGAVYFFGWRSLAVVLVSCVTAFLAEYVFCRRRQEPVSEAAFVTAVLFALTLPPTVPWHVVAISVAFAIVFTKEAFGGFGRNIFNPAITARCFAYVCFPVSMTSQWALPATGLWGALGQWTTAADPAAITTATPMALIKAGQLLSDPALKASLFLGGVGGSMGVTSALLILIGGLYLFITGTANRTVIITFIGVYVLLAQLLHLFGVGHAQDALTAVMSGGLLFAAFFMVTDPVSSPTTPLGRVLYAALIAVCVIVIRNFSIFTAGAQFSILIGNMFGPLFDFLVKARQKPAPAPAKAPAGAQP